MFHKLKYNIIFISGQHIIINVEKLSLPVTAANKTVNTEKPAQVHHAGRY